MTFLEFRKNIQDQFSIMTEGKLYRSSVSGQELWDLYLSSFKPEDNPTFRDPDSSKHNGNLDNSFFRRYGNIVSLDRDNNIISLFDKVTEGRYFNSSKNLRDKIKSSPIKDVFFETFEELKSLPYESCKKTQEVFRLGIESNHKTYTQEEADKFGVVEAGKVYKFNHLNLDLPKEFVDQTGKSIESIMGTYRDAKNVFQRAMEEIPLDILKLVRDLISQGSLLNGEAHLSKINTFIPFKEAYDKLDSNKDQWCWETSYKLPIAKFRNELIGVLCKELAEGEELNKACQSWNKRVDPVNYMKATALITENQKKNAQKFCEEHGYIESFDRRLATLDDIKADEIKHMNVEKGLKNVSIFDNVKTKSTQHKRSEFDNIEEVGIEKFMKDILPTCEKVEAFLENNQEGNLVTLTTSKDENCKQMFKWNNPYSWTYKGNLAGKSQIKESVKNQGGKVDGVLRFSIMWSEGNSTDNSDLDAHCEEPGGNLIYYSNSRSSTGGNLDIDITNPSGHKSRNGKEVVENITYPSLNKMKDGTYRFIVNQYSARNSQGFKAEIEFDGEIYEYEYKKPVRGQVLVADVTLKDGKFTINHSLPSSSSSREIYGLETKKFHKVDLVCLSPNHWANNNTGNKHYFFMLNGAKAEDSLRSFHSENLKPELAEHRKVLEVLGTTTMIEPKGKQLSGLGFNSTVRSEVILKLGGSHKRVIKVKF